MALSERLEQALAAIEWPEPDEEAVADHLAATPVFSERTGKRIGWTYESRRWDLGEALVRELVIDHGSIVELYGFRVWLLARDRRTEQPEEPVRVRSIAEPVRTAAGYRYLFTVDAPWAHRLMHGLVVEQSRRHLVHVLDSVLAIVQSDGKLRPKVHAEPAWLVRRWEEPLTVQARTLLELGAQMALPGLEPPAAGGEA